MSARILVIDDSLTLRKFIEKTLIKLGDGYSVVTASDGRQGILKAEDGPYDLIFLDYMLPDMKGEEICSVLLSMPETAHIPIVLMGSYTDEINKTRERYPNVVDALNKPFSPELLVSTAQFVLSNQHVIPSGHHADGHSREHSPNPNNIKIRGLTGFISLTNSLRTIESNRLTGVMRVFHGKYPVETYTKDGKVMIVSTKDVDLYLEGSSFGFAANKIWEACEKGQQDSGCPLFILMAERNLMPWAMAHPLMEIHGHRLFSQLWTLHNIEFQYEELGVLPSFVDRISSIPKSCMDEWILKTMRYVNHQSLHDATLDDIYGIPVLRRVGYENLSRFQLNREENLFVANINSSNTLADICELIALPLDEGKRILFRLLSIDYIEFWPSAYFARQEAVS
ncbi:response regulator [Kamptonema cortianum]|nr:response regulator [Oscillatoria laete-virens]MDK3161851.1 response regulator [Kamptonema cortianum]MDL5054421.1 response regulator [Oscillatoria laete-virens NRMC-F 0139]